MPLNVLWFLPFMSYIRVCTHFVYKNCIAVNAVCISFNENRHILSHHYQFLRYISATVNVPSKIMKPNLNIYHMTVIHFTGSCSPQPPNHEHQIGPILETALQRAPILHIHAGKLQLAVFRYRYFCWSVAACSFCFLIYKICNVAEKWDPCWFSVVEDMKSFLIWWAPRKNYSHTVVQGGTALLPIRVRCSSYCLDMNNDRIFSPLRDVIFKSNRICNFPVFSLQDHVTCSWIECNTKFTLNTYKTAGWSAAEGCQWGSIFMSWESDWNNRSVPVFVLIRLFGIRFSCKKAHIWD